MFGLSYIQCHNPLNSTLRCNNCITQEFDVSTYSLPSVRTIRIFRIRLSTYKKSDLWSPFHMVPGIKVGPLLYLLTQCFIVYSMDPVFPYDPSTMKLNICMTVFKNYSLEHLTKCNNFPNQGMYTFYSFFAISSSGLPFVKMYPPGTEVVGAFTPGKSN